MRIFKQPKVIATVAFGLLGLTAFSAAPVSAQVLSPLPSYQKDPLLALRVGGYFPANTRVRNAVSSTLICGGIDYTISHTATTRTIASVDYISHTNGGQKLQIIPVTYGQTRYSAEYSSPKTYYGFGVGAYFTQMNIFDVAGLPETDNAVLYGGYLGAGVEIGDTLFLDARYHFTTTVGSANPGGVEVTAGVRF